MILVYLFYSALLCFSSAAAEPASVFRFHSSQEPPTLDPGALNEATGGFFLYNLFRGLYRLDQNGELTPELAKGCQWMDSEFKKLNCKMRENGKFSNGNLIKAEHVVKSWQRLLSKTTRSKHSELLLNIKNASKILRDELPASKLGVEADNLNLEILFDQPDPEFIDKLVAIALTPLYSDPPTRLEDFKNLVTNGPFLITDWQKKTRLVLKPNPHYHRSTSRPQIEMLIIEEDSSAMQLYDLGKLDFLRRLPVIEISKRKKRPDFHFISTLRFDYMGFGNELQSQPKLREALIYSLNYPELTKAYQTPGTIGCPSLPKNMAKPWPCIKFDLKRAKRAWSKVSPADQLKTYTLSFSKNAGDDVTRGMEWMQAQWRKHLGAKIMLRPLELKMFLSELRSPNLSLFRKGINLDRATCTSALENFALNNPENFLGFKSIAFTQIVNKLSHTSDQQNKIELCGQGLNLLLKESALIPMGEMYFAMLAKTKFKGWYLTKVQQFDLTELKASAP